MIAPRFLGAAGYDKRDIGVVMGGFNLASLVMSPTVPWLLRRFGFSRVIAGGCALTALGAVAFGSSTTLVAYTIARAIQGVGMACLMVGGVAYVAEVTPSTRLGRALGAAGVLTLVAQALGPVLAEFIHDRAGWPWVWRGGIISGALATLLATTLAPVPSRAPDSAATRSSATVALIVTALAGVGFGAVWTFLADYGPRVGAPRVTLFFSSYVIAAVSTRLLFGGLSDRIGRRAAAAPALVGHAVALCAMAKFSASWHLAVIGTLYGLCHGVYYPTLQALVVERSGGRRSQAIAASTFGFGSGIVIAAFGLGPVARAWGYPTIYVVAAGAGLSAAALVWWRVEYPPGSLALTSRAAPAVLHTEAHGGPGS